MRHESDSDVLPARRKRAPVQVDPGWLSATIGAIYDCVLEPDRWTETIASIAREFNFANAVLGVVRPDSQDLLVHVGFDDEWIRRRNDYVADAAIIWGGERTLHYALAEPLQSTQITPYAIYSKLAYYRDILEPRGIHDAILIPLASEPTLVGYFAVNRHVSAGPIGSRELEGMRLLGSHLRRAVTISGIFDLRGAGRATFGAVLESLGSAVVLVDDGLRIVHTNRAAHAAIDALTSISVADGTLRLADRTAHTALQSAVRHAAVDEALIGHRGIGIPAPSASGPPAVLHVLPLRGDVRGGVVTRATAAIFIASAGVSRSAPIDAIALLYDLTPAESQVFAAISRGTTLAETATTLGIARSTVRTHLSRIFKKTECSRQADLIELASRLSLAV